MIVFTIVICSCTIVIVVKFDYRPTLMYIMDNMLCYRYVVEPWPNVMCALSSWSGLWTGLQVSLDILFIQEVIKAILDSGLEWNLECLLTYASSIL